MGVSIKQFKQEKQDQYCKWNKALDVLQQRYTHFYTETAMVFGINCEGLANSLDRLYKYILCCFITKDYLTLLYSGLIGTAAQYTITQRMCAPESVHQSNSLKSLTSGSTNFLTKHEFGSVSSSKRRVWFIADELTQIFSVKKKKTWQHFSSVSTCGVRDPEFFKLRDITEL